MQSILWLFNAGRSDCLIKRGKNWECVPSKVHSPPLHHAPCHLVNDEKEVYSLVTVAQSRIFLFFLMFGSVGPRPSRTRGVSAWRWASFRLVLFAFFFLFSFFSRCFSLCIGVCVFKKDHQLGFAHLYPTCLRWTVEAGGSGAIQNMARNVKSRAVQMNLVADFLPNESKTHIEDR